MRISILQGIQSNSILSMCIARLTDREHNLSTKYQLNSLLLCVIFNYQVNTYLSHILLLYQRNLFHPIVIRVVYLNDSSSDRMPPTHTHHQFYSHKMNASITEDTLRLLSKKVTEREHALAQFSPTRQDEPEHDVDTKSPILDSYRNTGGINAIISMINFTPAELRRLYATLDSYIISSWKNRRGKRSEFKPLDVLFMILTVMKHGPSGDSLALIFQVKAPTYILFISLFTQKLYPYAGERYVDKPAKESTLD